MELYFRYFEEIKKLKTGQKHDFFVQSMLFEGRHQIIKPLMS